MRPLAIDLYCGLGGWTDGLLAEGYDVIGFDIEQHRYPAQALPESDGGKGPGGIKLGASRDRADAKAGSFNYANECALRDAPLTGEWMQYPGTLVIQDVLTLHGSQFRDADLIVASPPCQEYSYMAMPWKRAKAKAAAIRADKTGRERERLNALFNACFRLKREASEAAGRDIPLIVENVRGAIPWVGRSRWNYGSFYLWGDVPALMPNARAFKSTGLNWSDQTKRGQDFTRHAGRHAMEGIKGVPHRTKGHWTNPAEHEGVKSKDADGYERNHPAAFGWKSPRTSSAATHARKAASAVIAKIPLPLSRYIAATFKPKPLRTAA